MRYPYHLHGVPESDLSLVHGPGTWTIRGSRDGVQEERTIDLPGGFLGAEVIREGWRLGWTIPGGPQRLEIIGYPEAGGRA